MRHILRYLPACTIAIVVATAAVRAEDRKEVYKFEFDGNSGPVSILLDSETMGFGLHDLAVGESRNAVTGDGKTVLVSRLENEIALDIDGQRFEIPAMHGMHDDMPGKHHGMAMHKLMADEGLIIISGEPLDETRKETIRAALEAAGITETLHFHAPGSNDGGHRVIIRKEIEDDGDGERVIINKRIIPDR